jgi:hypothetical protein
VTSAEMMAVASLDLASPTKAAQLKWVFWHADAVAEHEDAKNYLDDLYLWDRSVRSMIISTVVRSLKDAWTMDRPAKEQLEGARDALRETAARVKATELILGLLGKSAERLSKVTATTQPPASKLPPIKTGHMSQNGANGQAPRR